MVVHRYYNRIMIMKRRYKASLDLYGTDFQRYTFFIGLTGNPFKLHLLKFSSSFFPPSFK